MTQQPIQEPLREQLLYHAGRGEWTAALALLQKTEERDHAELVSLLSEDETVDGLVECYIRYYKETVLGLPDRLTRRSLIFAGVGGAAGAVFTLAAEEKMGLTENISRDMITGAMLGATIGIMVSKPVNDAEMRRFQTNEAASRAIILLYDRMGTHQRYRIKQVLINLINQDTPNRRR